MSSAVGLGCVLAWSNIVFFSRLVHYSTRNDIAHLNSTYAFACVGMIAAFLACAAIARLRTTRPGLIPDAGNLERVAPVAAAGVLCAATLILVLIEHNLFTQPWCGITSTLSGCAAALLMLAWARLICAGRTPLAATSAIASASVLAAVLFVIVLYLPDVPAIILTALLPLASLALLRRTAATEEQSDNGDTSASANEQGRFEGSSTRALVRTLVAMGLLALAESLMRALFLAVDPGADSVPYRWLVLLSAVVAAGVLLLAAGRRSRPAAVRITCRVSLFALVFLTMLTPIVDGIGLAADLTTLVCYAIFNLLVWIYLALTVRAYRVPADELFGLGLGVAYLGCLAGTFGGGLLASFGNLDYRGLSLAALLCAMAMLASLLFITDEEVVAHLVDLDSERPQAPRRFRLRIESVAREFGLTSKEVEVMTLAAKGRSTQRICEDLGISTGTANTHLMHIYKKLDVHDRQQMLDLIDSRGTDAQ